MGVEQAKRLYFIDAMRAWAILMMLQGHFIDGLLDPAFRDPENPVFATWKYFRGITAPVFFTVSGFIFTFLLIRVPRQGLDNPRIRKGLNRGLQLIGIGYLLRTNFLGLLQGVIYPSFYVVDVLHCIGAALLLIVGLYVLSVRLGERWFAPLLLLTGLSLFLFEPVYSAWDYSMLPDLFANYLTKARGSVFTVFPWVGYAAIGGFLAMAFYRFRESKHLYLKSIGISLLAGSMLLWLSSPLFAWLGGQTGLGFLSKIALNNYLFIRLGDVMLVFSVFIMLRALMNRPGILRIGQNTLSIYVIHFIILYGSFTGMGLYRFYNLSLPPAIVIPGALLFMACCTWLALQYDKREVSLKQGLIEGALWLRQNVAGGMQVLWSQVKILWFRLSRLLGWDQRRA
jgi:uncharacterized membrane protein